MTHFPPVALLSLLLLEKRNLIHRIVRGKGLNTVLIITVLIMTHAITTGGPLVMMRRERAKREIAVSTSEKT